MTAHFAYDGAGRQVEHAGLQLRYDALSHLTEVTGVAGGTAVHQYGYDGNRVATRSAAGDMPYWITPNVVVRDHYIHVGDRLVAKITTSTTDGSSVTATGVIRVTRSRAGLAGVALVPLLTTIGLAVTRLFRWRHGLRIVRPMGAVLATSLALLVVAIGCTGGATLSRRASAPTGEVAVWHATMGPYHDTHRAAEVATGAAMMATAAGEVNAALRAGQVGLRLGVRSRRRLRRITSHRQRDRCRVGPQHLRARRREFHVGGERCWGRTGGTVDRSRRKACGEFNAPWGQVVANTKSGPAKYLPGTDVETLERFVWAEGAEGAQVTNGRPWKVMEFADGVGASGGKVSRWVRVEESAGTIHGHPITETEFRKLTR